MAQLAAVNRGRSSSTAEGSWGAGKSSGENGAATLRHFEASYSDDLLLVIMIYYY